jgi:hypothetical protein
MQTSCNAERGRERENDAIFEKFLAYSIFGRIQFVQESRKRHGIDDFLKM